MDSQQQQASERIRQASNILVTVSNNPSVDQLAACIGLTISLNKMGKHATAVFSGEVPSTLEFLQPEKTIEKNTDSLRDFIIALDKSKADKLRYKVEDRVVKIFITPYRTSITDKDLEFSQGDFNVDVIIALGVHNQEELDFAITSHGRILHDATIVTINSKPGGELGSINWLNPNASSLSELTVQLVNVLDKTLIDGQVATAFLTGIVSETERFSNNKTTPQTMSISAQLMSSGANQQLVATKLEEPAPPPPPATVPIAAQKADGKESEPAPVKKSNDGTLEIAHDETKSAADEEAEEDREETTVNQPKAVPAPQIRIDEHGSLTPAESKKVEPPHPAIEPIHTEDTRQRKLLQRDEAELEDLLPPVKHGKEPTISHHNEAPKMILEPPTLGGELTASATPGQYDREPEAGGLPNEEGGVPSSMDDDIPSVGTTIMPPGEEVRNAPGTSFLGDQPLLTSDGKPETEDADGVSLADEAGKTLSDIERDVHSSHVAGLSETQPSTPVPDNGPAPTDNLTPPPINVVPPAPTEPDPIVSAFTPPAPSNGAMLPPVSTVSPSTNFVPPADEFPPVDGVPNSDVLSVPDMPTPGADASTNGSNAIPDVDSARDAVMQAMGGSSSQNLDPIQGLNAQSLGGNLRPEGANNTAAFTDAPTTFSASMGQPSAPVAPWTPTPTPAANMGQPASQYGTMPPAPAFTPQSNQPSYAAPYQGQAGAPPEVPPPIVPPMPPR